MEISHTHKKNYFSLTNTSLTTHMCTSIAIPFEYSVEHHHIYLWKLMWLECVFLTCIFSPELSHPTLNRSCGYWKTCSTKLQSTWKLQWLLFFWFFWACTPIHGMAHYSSGITSVTLQTYIVCCAFFPSDTYVWKRVNITISMRGCCLPFGWVMDMHLLCFFLKSCLLLSCKHQFCSLCPPHPLLYNLRDKGILWRKALPVTYILSCIPYITCFPGTVW